MELLTGVAKPLSSGVEVGGYMVNGQGGVTSANSATFEVNGQVVQMKSKSAIPLSAGDYVAVAGGRDRNGVFHAHAMKNVSRCIVVDKGPIINIVLGILLFVLGLPFSVIIIGIPAVLFGLYCIFQGIKFSIARNMVAPIQPIPAAA